MSAPCYEEVATLSQVVAEGLLGEHLRCDMEYQTKSGVHVRYCDGKRGCSVGKRHWALLVGLHTVHVIPLPSVAEYESRPR